jgi:hypothetical protein
MAWHPKQRHFTLSGYSEEFAMKMLSRWHAVQVQRKIRPSGEMTKFSM